MICSTCGDLGKYICTTCPFLQYFCEAHATKHCVETMHQPISLHYWNQIRSKQTASKADAEISKMISYIYFISKGLIKEIEIISNRTIKHLIQINSEISDFGRNFRVIVKEKIVSKIHKNIDGMFQVLDPYNTLTRINQETVSKIKKRNDKIKEEREKEILEEKKRIEEENKRIEEENKRIEEENKRIEEEKKGLNLKSSSKDLILESEPLMKKLKYQRKEQKPVRYK